MALYGADGHFVRKAILSFLKLFLHLGQIQGIICAEIKCQGMFLGSLGLTLGQPMKQKAAAAFRPGRSAPCQAGQLG